MSRYVLVVDTNVLLHRDFFTNIDWRDCVSASEVVLAVCPPVIRALDRQKTAVESSRKVRERAQVVVKRMAQLVKGDQPVMFRLLALGDVPRAED